MSKHTTSARAAGARPATASSSSPATSRPERPPLLVEWWPIERPLPHGGAAMPYAAAFAVSTAGSHTISYFATDKAGNVEATKTGFVNIDTSAPVTTAMPASVKAGKRVTLRFRVDDALPSCGMAVVQIQIKRGAKVVKTVRLGSKATSVALTYVFAAKLAKGSYTYRVLATDIAGNAASRIGSAKLLVK